TQNYTVQSYLQEARSKEVSYTAYVPKQLQKTVTVTNYRTEPEEHTETYHVRVPIQVTNEVPVQVCRMIPQTVTVDARAFCGGCGKCGNCCR
ncbi:MAG: hypothetical protein ABI614_27215, partial [Planctomycetota bacterium]